MELEHAVLVHHLKNLVKVSMVIVDNVPAQSPSWEGVNLREGSSTLTYYSNNLQ